MKSFVLIVAALSGMFGASFNAGALTVSGTIAVTTNWRPVDSPVLVTGNVSVPAGVTLTVEAGVVVNLASGVSLSALSGGTLELAGTAENPVRFLPSSAGDKWGQLRASGNQSYLAVRHAELAAGGVDLGAGATGLIEDTFIHDVPAAVVANSAKFVTMRRIHVKNYAETVFNSGTVILAEDSLFENMTAPNSDALEIQGGPPGSIIRRCTFRHSSGSNSDAVDFNGTAGVLIHDCLIYDFSDKGISLGASGIGGQPDRGIILSNCCIYAVDTGVAVKDGTTCALYQLTVADCVTGLRLYQKFTAPVDGGHVTNSWNNIFWGNATAVSLTDNSSLAADFSDLQGTNWPGLGNISTDPVFLDPLARDYRLAADSPARGTGWRGADLGAFFSVGAPMAASHPGFTSISGGGGQLRLRFWVDSERSYSIQSRTWLQDGAGGWQSISDGLTDPLPREREFSVPLDVPASFLRLQAVLQP